MINSNKLLPVCSSLSSVCGLGATRRPQIEEDVAFVLSRSNLGASRFKIGGPSWKRKSAAEEMVVANGGEPIRTVHVTSKRVEGRTDRTHGMGKYE